jgi:DNA polymerase-1
MNRIFVVDGNWYLHRCFFTLKTSRPIGDVLPLNFLGLVCKDACAVRATHVLVCFDGPQVFRYKLYPEYKANRREKDVGDSEDEGGKDLYQYLPQVRKLLADCGIAFRQSAKHEADDCLTSAGIKWGDDHIVIFGTADKDTYQGLRKNVSAYNSTAKPTPIMVTAAKAEKKKGVPISGMVMFQTLTGDPTDNVPELLSPGKAKAAVNKWGTFKQWYTKGTKEDRRWLTVNQVALQLNRKLVELVTDISLPDLDELRPQKKQIEDMPRAWYELQAFLYPKSKGLFKR